MNKRGLFVVVALVVTSALVGLAYAPAVAGEYLWDDHALVEHAPPSLLRPLFAPDPMSDGRAPYFRPLVLLSFRVDAALLGPGAPADHVVNVLLHLAAAAMLAAAARRLGASLGAALMAAATWALLPRSTEAVAWISGRTDVLCTLLGLGAIAVWPWRTEDAADANRRAAVASALLFAALLAKEVAIAAVVAIAVGAYAGGARRRLAWLAAPLALYLPLRGWALAGAAATPLPFHAGTVFEAAGRYLAMTLDPWHPKTSAGLVGQLAPGYAIAGAGAMLLALGLGVRSAMRRRSIPAGALVGGALAAAAIAPALQVIPIGLMSAVAADRLLYLPLAGVALALSVLAGRLSARGRLAAAVLSCAVAASFVPVTRARAGDYTDELTFWLAAAESAAQGNTAPTTALANAVRQRGDAPLACRLYTSARATLERTGRADTARHGRVLENLASCLALVGRYDESRAVYILLLRSRPDAARVTMGLAYTELHRFDLDGAEAAFRRALVLEPSLVAARRDLAEIPAIRAEATRLGTDEARAADPIGWARLLTLVGRMPEAQERWSTIATDPRAPLPAVREGAELLVASGDVGLARRAVEACAARFDATDLRARLSKREAERARVAALAPRIEDVLAR